MGERFVDIEKAAGPIPAGRTIIMNIIYENKDVLVVNKPAGILVHPTENSKEKTAVDWLLKHYPEIRNVGDPAVGGASNQMRPGIVHRLDKDTSGVMIIAKNQPAFEFLKKQFQERKVKKTYIALVVGELKTKEGTINLPIGRSKKSPLKRLASLKARGKLREAITEYKVLENFKDYTLVEAYPKTGRTHQIRVHFKAVSHPVVCDKLYGGKLARQLAGPICPFGLSRQFLHAYSLELILPDGSRSRFEADLADDLKKVLEELRKISKYDTN